MPRSTASFHPLSAAGVCGLVLLSACAKDMARESPSLPVSEPVAAIEETPPPKPALGAVIVANDIGTFPDKNLSQAFRRTADAPPPPAAPAAEIAFAQLSAKAAESQRAMIVGNGVQSAIARKKAMGSQMLMPAPSSLAAFTPEDRENYAHTDDNPIHRAAESPVSTFSVDVDTGAYANARRFLREGRLPPRDAVRVEELINYFGYDYAAPKDRKQPFGVVTEMAPTPWNPKTQLLRVGIQGWKPQGPAPASNLVFLVDVSGSMNSPDKLPLVKASLKLLTQQLGAKDRVSLVIYAGRTDVVLEPTPGDRKAEIIAAIDQLNAGGGTNGGAGIDLAYAMAQQGFIKDGVNRVLLATDGDFNVGISSFERLMDLVKEKRKGGIALTTLGYGSGNYNERLMEQLADAGNGHYAYIDSAAEAQKVLVRQRESTLITIARDVKVQIEFNPKLVAEYRLIGYENRALKREDFSNDQVDAGEIGAGHSVTALYEIALAGSGGERSEPLRYGGNATRPDLAGEIAHLRLRYKLPSEGMQARSHLIERPLLTGDIKPRWDAASNSFRWAASVAAFGQLLRGGQYLEGLDYTRLRQLANAAKGDDVHGEAGEFLQLIELAQSLSTPVSQNTVPNEGG